MEYIQEIMIDINAKDAFPVVYAKQGDSRTRFVLVHYLNDGEIYEVSENNSVALRVKKPDSHYIFDTCIVKDGAIIVPLSEQCLAFAGRAEADLAIFSSEERVLSGQKFVIIIQNSPDVMGNAALSSDEFTYLKDFVNRGNDIIAEAQEWAIGYNGEDEITDESPAYENHAKYWAGMAAQAAGSANEAERLAYQDGEAFANGTRDGEAITDTSDPAYHKNSKYWSDVATENGKAWSIGIRNNQPVTVDDPAYNKYAKFWSEKAEENAQEAALSGEAFANGTRNGTIISSTDPAYHKNSKYWSDVMISDAEAFANGTRNNIAISSTDIAYHKNSKYWSDVMISDAEAFANGTRNGEAISNTDVAYHKNSKYWSDRIKECIEEIQFVYNPSNGILSMEIDEEL